jgi:hypothetical protein
MHDTQPHWVQEQVKRVHDATIPYLLLFPKLGKQNRQRGSPPCKANCPGTIPA